MRLYDGSDDYRGDGEHRDGGRVDMERVSGVTVFVSGGWEYFAGVVGVDGSEFGFVYPIGDVERR
jgi:hypothetical protein